MRGKKISTALLLLAILAALAFIWGNSLDSAVESAAKSGRVGELLRPLLELVVGQGGVTDHLIRKLAHFAEYAVLGALLLLLTAVGFRVHLQTVVNCLFFSDGGGPDGRDHPDIYRPRPPDTGRMAGLCRRRHRPAGHAGAVGAAAESVPLPQTCGCLSYP